jgi:hypothetical protein
MQTGLKNPGHTIGSALGAMALHGDVGIEMVQGTIGLFAAVIAALVHALNLLITPPRTLMLLGAGNRDEAVDLRQPSQYGPVGQEHVVSAEQT